MRAGAYQVPRPETYVRDLGTPKRRGCQNSILDARSLRRGLHPPHLHPRYKTDAAKGRGENGQFHGAGHVSRKSKNTGEKAKASSPVLFGSIGIIPRVGHGVGQAVDPHFDPHLFQRFCNKKHRKPKFSMLFVVCRQKRCRRQSLVPQWVCGYNPFLTRQTAEHPSHGGYSAVHLLIHRFPAQSPFCCPGTGCGWFPRPPP